MRRFSEYKRCFTFGCSLTRYKWPTWSDIIKQDIPETYNYGEAGAGNLYISNQLVEANLRYKFNKNDLVIVMWSSVTREDRYKRNQWVTSGNITTQNNISAKFVHDWFDYRFYLLRDLGLIELTRQYMKQSKAEFYMLNMAPFEIDDMISFNLTPEMKNSDYGDIKRVYATTLESIQPDILNDICGGSWPVTPIKGSKGRGQTADYHPRPEHHLKYIAKRFPNHMISKNMREFALRTDKKVLKASSFDDLGVWWNEHANKPGQL